MRHIKSAIVAMALLLGISALGVFGQAEASKQQAGFLAILKPGQQVIVKEAVGRYEISFFEEGLKVGLTHSVTEVGPDHVVVRDIADFSDTRIPIYSLKSIITIRALKN
jgi:hypothetical protein